MTRNSFLPEIIKITQCDPEDAPLVAKIMREIANKPLGQMKCSEFKESAYRAFSRAQIQELFTQAFALN